MSTEPTNIYSCPFFRIQNKCVKTCKRNYFSLAEILQHAESFVNATWAITLAEELSLEGVYVRKQQTKARRTKPCSAGPVRYYSDKCQRCQKGQFLCFYGRVPINYSALFILDINSSSSINNTSKNNLTGIIETTKTTRQFSADIPFSDDDDSSVSPQKKQRISATKSTE
jgi:hypothetical protein